MHQRVLLYIVGCGLSEHIGDIVIERTEVISMSAWVALVGFCILYDALASSMYK
jgi:hypothetical protein